MTLTDSRPQADDVVICVLGSTGSGKSTFIRQFSGNDSVKTGHSLESETTDIQRVDFIDNNSGRKITIVDTPGFDDSREADGMTDTEVLKRITSFLLEQYDSKRKLNGLVYVQSISNTRFSGQNARNLKIFEELTGTEGFKNVVVLTTFWDKVTKQEGERRESELQTKFFKELVEGGATFIRRTDSQDKGQSVLQHVLTLVPTDVHITKEIREEGKSLVETAAGSVRASDVDRIISKYQGEISDLQTEAKTMKEESVAARRELEEMQLELEKKLARWEEEKSDLRRGLEEERRKREEFTAEFQEWRTKQEKEWMDQVRDQEKARDDLVPKLQEIPMPVVRSDSNFMDSPIPYDDTSSGKGMPQQAFQFGYSEKFPPFLAAIPRKYQTNFLSIFDFTSLLQTTAATASLPDTTRFFDTAKVQSMHDLIERNHFLRRLSSTSKDILSRVTLGMYLQKNIGHRDDWYMDSAFGQQHFTGTNPTTITLASSRWLQEFTTIAGAQKREDITQILSSNPENLYVDDYSDYRSATGMSPNEEIKSGRHHGCASVVLFHLEPLGKLHPLAITIDYKSSMAESVTIFNRRVSSSSQGDEYNDWPWRYAKTCAQVSDWFRHEVAVHLTYTHLVEEVIIVSARRTLPSSHIILKLLEPHWQTTLTLNAAARSTLLPKIIIPMAGFTPDQTYAFVKKSYMNFDWNGSYVPNDLRRRGFPIEHLDDVKYHNYGYARCISRIWEIIRKFVSNVLSAVYPGGDAQVASDSNIAALCNDIRSINGGQLISFGVVKTLDELIDFVTMCIHIASPQHTAVNYLQQYYQTFVPNKPSALQRPLPRSLYELQSFGEKDLLSALPNPKSKDWLLMAQVPYLLSKEVADENTILHYAETTAESSSTPAVIRDAARVFKNDLRMFAETVKQYSEELDNQQTPYLVMDPYRTAISILI